ncbi:MAG: DUF72 domain-containing protein [Candidatus Solibacter usitatus]|nr:DUF72 domain-containing protein [Candidatus Solibacter usitatus]
MNLSLFGPEPEPGQPARSALARRLRELAAQGVYFGASSWKYPGWMGSIYTPERYFTRGRFSQKKFESECLAEYAETFPAVCGDFSFYQFPSETYWQRLFHSAPPDLKFAFKVPEEITVKEWPEQARYGARGGGANESFLNAALFDAAFLRPLEPYRERVAALIFEFGTLPKRHYESVAPFAQDLGRFLAALPPGWRYSVEIRNHEFLDPRYFAALREHNAAHVFSSWTRMPELPEQLSASEAFTADFAVARALLRPGRSYEQAVTRFQPYARLQEPHPPARQGLKQLMEQSMRKKQAVFLFVNNRLEGNAPSTIQAVVGA